MNLPRLEHPEHTLPTSEIGTTSQLLADIGKSILPKVAILTCWELGFSPDQLSHARPGEIMVVQNPGGLVPPTAMDCQSAALDSLAYSMECPSLRHLIVCGHSECRTLRLMLDELSGGQPNPFGWLLENVHDRFQSLYRHRAAKEWPGLIVQEAVLTQLENLRTHPEIKPRLQRGQLLLHGWVRDDRTAAITAYDPLSGQFRQ